MTGGRGESRPTVGKQPEHILLLSVSRRARNQPLETQAKTKVVTRLFPGFDEWHTRFNNCLSHQICHVNETERKRTWKPGVLEQKKKKEEETCLLLDFTTQGRLRRWAQGAAGGHGSKH